MKLKHIIFTSIMLPMISILHTNSTQASAAAPSLENIQAAISYLKNAQSVLTQSLESNTNKLKGATLASTDITQTPGNPEQKPAIPDNDSKKPEELSDKEVIQTSSTSNQDTVIKTMMETSVITVSTNFYNDSSQTIRVQPLINGQSVGAAVDINYINKYPFNFGTVTASVMANQKLSYKITMPKASKYQAVLITYDEKNDNLGYKVNADGQNLIVTRLIKSSYTYKNATNVPLIITMTINNKVISQQITPGKEYTKVVGPLKTVTVEAHANLGGIYEQYDPQIAYNLKVDEQTQKLRLYPTSEQEKVLTNNSGWRILIDALSSDKTHDYNIIDNGGQYTPLESCTYITAIPLIPNNNSDAVARSCSITNKKGQLYFKF